MVRLENLLKISLQDVLKMSWRYLEDVFKTSWRRLEDALKRSRRRFEDVLKMSWRRLENVLKTSWRRLKDIWPRQIYWSWSRRLEDVLKTSSEDEDKRRLQDVFIKTNVCWVYFVCNKTRSLISMKVNGKKIVVTVWNLQSFSNSGSFSKND